jgi:hypothetical protein
MRQQMTASLRERAAYHEASHTAVAILYGIPVVSIDIDGATPHLLRGRYSRDDSSRMTTKS